MRLEAAVEAAGSRMNERVHSLAKVSDSVEWLERSLFSPASEAAAYMMKGWMLQADLNVQEDVLTNLIGYYRPDGVDPEAPYIHMGSHYDTVVNGGAYDGMLGVLLSIAAVESLKEARIPLRHQLSAVAFCDEEGVRFHSTFLGSAFLSGQFEHKWLHLEDGVGKTLGEWIVDRGDSPEDIFNAEPFIRPQDIFLEAHIEQGPILETRDFGVGVFTAIAAQLRAEVVVKGMAGHAGTIPASLRKDPLPAVAEMILLVEQTCVRDESRRVTVGKVDVMPNASNVIPGTVKFTIDLRQPNYAGLIATFQRLEAEIHEIANRRNLECVVKVIQDAQNVDCDPGITAALSAACVRKQKRAPQLISGAGHDSMKIAQVCPVGMLAVRCRDGLSHHPNEFASEEDCLLALKVMVDTVIELDKRG